MMGKFLVGLGMQEMEMLQYAYICDLPGSDYS